ncbi:MAG: cytochrome c [Spirochaetia bacterium]|nr:cytochrome c [Spirochaetia bacterium]
MSNESNNIPSWIKILFGGVLLAGVAYAVYFHAGNPTTHASQFHNAVYSNVVKATVEIIPVRNAASIANGEKSYKTACAGCHGGNMEGGFGPNLNDGTWLHEIKTESGLVRLINMGIAPADAKSPGKSMPPKGGQKLSGEQIWEIVYYIGSKNGSVIKDSPAQ